MRPHKLLAVVGLLGLVAAACSSQDVAAFCDGVVAAEAAFSAPEPDPAVVQEAVAIVEAEAPDELTGQVATVVAAVGAASAGDFSVFESEEFVTAEQEVEAFMIENCGYETASVTALDYAFAGLPQSIDTGTHAFNFTNSGSEVHEMAIARINEGVTLSVSEILQLPEEEAFQMVQPVGFAFAVPGESDTTFVNLEPGNYAIVCFIPQGTTPEKLPALEAGELEGGPPHFTLGMLTEFTVEG